MQKYDDYDDIADTGLGLGSHETAGAALAALAQGMRPKCMCIRHARSTLTLTHTAVYLQIGTQASIVLTVFGILTLSSNFYY